MSSLGNGLGCMDIYKLSDELCSDSGDSFLRITELRQGVRDENRVNVFVNGKYALSLDIAQVVELGVKVGQIVSEERLAELRRASEFGKVYQRALEWVLMRPRSVREVREYLRRGERTRQAKERQAEWRVTKGQAGEREGAKKSGRERAEYDFDEVIVERLTTRGYVDDRKFAEFWVENRFVKKGVSEKRLRIELAQKGVAKEIIDEVLLGRDEEAELKKMIARKRAKYDDEKLMAYLCRQGFDYGLVRELVAETKSD